MCTRSSLYENTVPSLMKFVGHKITLLNTARFIHSFCTNGDQEDYPTVYSHVYLSPLNSNRYNYYANMVDVTNEGTFSTTHYKARNPTQ